MVVAVTDHGSEIVDSVAREPLPAGDKTWMFWHGQRGAGRPFSLGGEIELVDESGKFQFLPLIVANHPAAEPESLKVISPSGLRYVDALPPGRCPLVAYQYREGKFDEDSSVAAFLARPVPPSSSIRQLLRELPWSRSSPTLSARLIKDGIVLGAHEFWPEIVSMGKATSVSNSTGPFGQRIFASYAREDLAVVESVASVIESLRLGQLHWDLRFLRSGDDWRDGIRGEIESANLFQLFWSAAAKRSEAVRDEWTYALRLRRPHFISPVYWTDPLYKPPRALAGLHFSRISLLENQRSRR